MTIRKIDLPDCCATCRFMRWEEGDMECLHPANLPDSEIAYDEPEGDEPGQFYYDIGTYLEHFACVCEHFTKGMTYGHGSSDYEAETDALIEAAKGPREQKFLQDLELDAVRAHAARILDATFDEVLNKNES